MKNKYYSLKNILSNNADYNLIIGERSNGKTFATLQYIIDSYMKDKKEGAYIRRWEEDIIGKRAETIFSAIVESGYLSKYGYDNIVYSKGAFFFANYDAEKKKMLAEKNPFCYIFSLSHSEHYKSNSYPKISNIVFDEFITRRVYLADEFVIFMNLLSTIIRDRDGIKIFMLGNTVNKYCPYFEELGIANITTMKQGSIDVYSYGDSDLKLAIEYCDNLNKKKQSNKYFAFNNSKLNMITNGQWELSLYPHIPIGYKINTKDIVFCFNVLFGKHKIQGDVISDDNGVFIFFHRRTSEIKENEIVYSLQDVPYKNYHKLMLNGYRKIDLKISSLFKSNKVFYQSNEIGEIIKNYLLQTTRFYNI